MAWVLDEIASFLPVDPKDSPLGSTPMASVDLFPEDLREQLEGLMLSLLQQSLSCQAHGGLQETCYGPERRTHTLQGGTVAVGTV